MGDSLFLKISKCCDVLDGKWVIGNPATEVGGLESVEGGLAGVPSHPWRYYTHHEVWVVDQQLTVTGKCNIQKK